MDNFSEAKKTFMKCIIYIPAVLLVLTIGCAPQGSPLIITPPPVQESVFEHPQASGIEIIQRDRWAQASPNMGEINPMGKIFRLTIHHEARVCYSIDWLQTVLRIRGIQKAHFQNGWADIGYHYLIDYKGRVWEGRSLRYQGAHVRDNNEGNIGIALLGNFNVQSPSKLQKESLKRLVEYLRTTYSIPKSRVYTHRELVVTECPGDQLQAYVNELRR